MFFIYQKGKLKEVLVSKKLLEGQDSCQDCQEIEEETEEGTEEKKPTP